MDRKIYLLLLCLLGVTFLFAQSPADIKRARTGVDYKIKDIKWAPNKFPVKMRPVVFKRRPATAGDQPALPKHTDPEGIDLSNYTDLSALLESEDEVAVLRLIGLFEDKLFHDKNPRSGVFYYFPNAFDLTYDQEKGTYGFEIDYPQGERSAEVPVTVAAGFRPDTKPELLDLVGKMIGSAARLLDAQERQAFQQQRIRMPRGLPVLEPAPLARPPEIQLALSSFGVSDEDVSISGYSDLGHRMALAWPMTIGQAESLVTAMAADYDLHGSVVLHPAGEDAPVFSIPLQLSLINPRTIGPYLFANTGTFSVSGMKNAGTLPLEIESVFVLAPEGSERVIYRHVRPHGLVVAPGSVRKTFSQEVGRAVREASYRARVLVTHRIGHCEECVLQARESILGTEATEARKPVAIREFKAYEISGADQVELDFDVIHQTVAVEHSGQAEVMVPVALDGSLSYRFKVILTLPDGEVKRTDYISSDQPRITLNEEFMRKHFNEYRKQ